MPAVIVEVQPPYAAVITDAHCSAFRVQQDVDLVPLNCPKVRRLLLMTTAQAQLLMGSLSVAHDTHIIRKNLNIELPQ